MKNLILVCGSRDWKDGRRLYERLSQEPSNTTVIEGEAPGADTMARQAAMLLGFSVIAVPANWRRYGKAAGPVRNRTMLDMKPDRVIAFHPDLTKSRGTADCVHQAMSRGIPVEVINE
jgi:hypothetical protein